MGKKKSRKAKKHPQIRMRNQYYKQMNQTFNTIFSEASNFYINNHFDKAIELYLKAYQIEPNNINLLASLHCVYYQTNNFEKALMFLSKLLQNYIDTNFDDFAKSPSAALCGLKNLLVHNFYLIARQLGTPSTQAFFYNNQDLVSHVISRGPVRIRIETSSKCNLRCQHCPTGLSYDSLNREVMSMATFNKTIKQIQNIDTLYSAVMYLGGEPLLNKNIAEMCQRIKTETHIKHTQFNTNAMLLTENNCKVIADCDLNLLQISIDGNNPLENDEIRKYSNYLRIKQNVHCLMKHINPSIIQISNIQLKKADSPKTPTIPQYLKDDFPGVIIETFYAMKWPGLDIDKSDLNITDVEEVPADSFCISPLRELSIRGNGDVVLCCYDLLGKKVMGNIHQDSIYDIWNSDEYKNIRSHMIQKNYKKLPSVCKTCPLYSGKMYLVIT